MGHRRNAASMRYPCGTFHPALIEDGLTGLEIMLPGVVPTRVYWFQEKDSSDGDCGLLCTKDDTLIG